MPTTPRFTPWTGQQPPTRFSPTAVGTPPAPTAPMAPTAPGPLAASLGTTPGPRFTPVPRTGGVPTGQPTGPSGGGPDLAQSIGLGLGGLQTGLTGFQLANQAGGLGLNLGGYQQALGGLTGAYGLAQGIRMDNPLQAIGGGLQAANSLSGLAGGPTFSSLLGSAGGYVAPGIGAALGIIQNALAGNVEPEKQAFDASLAAVSAGLAPMTGGLSLLAPVAMALGGPLFGEKPSVYDAKRNTASRQVDNALTGINQTLRSSLQSFADTGNLTEALTGVRAGFGGAAGNSVRSQLELPQAVATALGFEGPTAQWQTVTPQQFGSLLQAMAAQPDQGMSWITGSGDIPYVNQAAAQNVAAEVKAQTGDYLHAIMAALGLVPAEPWTSLYAPYVERRKQIAAIDAAAMELWNSPQFQNPEGYQPPPPPRDPATDIWSGSA